MQHIGHNVGNALAHLRQCGVIDAHLVIIFHPFGRNGAFQFGEGGRCTRTCSDAIGVHPGMKLYATLVCLADEPGQRIPTGLLTTAASDIFCPGLVGRVVEGVGHRSDLEHHSIDVVCLQAVKNTQIVFLLALGYFRCRAHAVGPVDMVNCCHPYGTEIFLWQCGGYVHLCL